MNEKLNNAFQKLYEKYFKIAPGTKLYHYTNHGVIEDILQEQQLRYGDYRSFNDPTELKFAQKIMLETIINNISEHWFVERTQKLFDDFNIFCQFYIACFSTEDKLALWRYYASNGTGFAIVFDFEMSENKNGSFYDSYIYRMHYGKEKTKKIIGEYIEVLNKYRASNRTSKCDLSLLTSHLIPIMPAFKDDSFEDEDEVRIWYIEGKLCEDKNHPEGFWFQSHSYDVKVPKGLPPYVKSPQKKRKYIIPESFKKTEIKKIIIGPSCKFHEAKKYIKGILSENGYDCNNIDIEQCSLPYKAN